MLLGASRRSRAGMILLVVISLLMLFAIVGLAFVIYAQAQASTARIWRESEDQRQPDMDSEMLLSYFLGQLIYGTDNPQSALRGHDLAHNMYGRRGGTVAFNGTGRTRNMFDYSDGRDPDQESLNPPYTYPDINHMYLAAQRGGDGKVLIPSFYRDDQITLRAKGLPPMPPSGDVQNIADGPGFRDGPNDSIWIDAGAPVMLAQDGRKFKALFAPLIVDLDGRVNINTAGNYDVNTSDTKTWNTPVAHRSHQGWGPWEINPDKVLGLDNGAGNQGYFLTTRLADGFQGRYKEKSWQSVVSVTPPAVAPPATTLHGNYLIGGRARYSPTDIDAKVTGTPPTIKNDRIYPQNIPLGASNLDNGNAKDYHADRNHPAIYNVFNPDFSPFVSNVGLRNNRGDRRFPTASMEAIVRYRDIGSPALAAEPFWLSRVFTNPTNQLARRLITTDSTDLLVPGLLGPLNPQAPPAANAGFIDINRAIRNYPNFSPTESANFAKTPDYRKAVGDRQELAQEIYDLLLQVTGTPPDGDPAMRQRLGQLAANIVDYRDNDDYNTPFCWDPAQRQSEAGWVFGVELPRVVLNEVYTEIADNQTDKRQEVRFWVELLNPLEAYQSTASWSVPGVSHNKNDQPPWDTTSLDNVSAGYKSQGGIRLQMNPAGGTACYQLLICKTDEGLGDPSNTRGEPRGEVKLKINDYRKPPDFHNAYDKMPNLTEQQVRDAFNNANNRAINDMNNPTPGLPPYTQAEIDAFIANLDLDDHKNNKREFAHNTIGYGDYNGLNTGSHSGIDSGSRLYYLLGPERDKPDAKPHIGSPQHDDNMGKQEDTKNWSKPTLALADGDLGDFNPANPPNAMAYGVQQGGPAPTEHTLVLQKLCCQYMKHDPDPNSPTYNPYITIDYLKDVPVRKATDQPPHRSSVGKKQPNSSAVIADQTTPDRWSNPNDPPDEKGPNHTFFRINEPKDNPFRWLTFMDRPLISPIELLHVPATPPHWLTQQFIDPQNNKPYQHLAPWLDENAQLYRLLGFIHAGMRSPDSGVGARVAGKININTIWDKEVFDALCDANQRNTFKAPEVDQIFQAMMQHRTPGGEPSPDLDRPFLSLTVPPIQDPNQYPAGMGLDRTLLARSGQHNPDLSQAGLLFRHASAGADHPYYNLQLLNKIYNSTTTRSNVFAVWLTVGFFEVMTDGSLGEEISFTMGRHKRHRMFAIIDRTNLTLDPVNGNTAGAPPFFITMTATAEAGANSIDVSLAKGTYDGVPYHIQPIPPNNRLVIDPGPRQEIVTVTAAGPGGADSFDRLTIQPPLQRRHTVGAVVTNAGTTTQLGNPGPQRSFDVRNPKFAGVIRYFSILE